MIVAFHELIAAVWGMIPDTAQSIIEFIGGNKLWLVWYTLSWYILIVSVKSLLALWAPSTDDSYALCDAQTVDTCAYTHFEAYRSFKYFGVAWFMYNAVMAVTAFSRCVPISFWIIVSWFSLILSTLFPCVLDQAMPCIKASYYTLFSFWVDYADRDERTVWWMDWVEWTNRHVLRYIHWLVGAFAFVLLFIFMAGNQVVYRPMYTTCSMQDVVYSNDTVISMCRPYGGITYPGNYVHLHSNVNNVLVAVFQLSGLGDMLSFLFVCGFFGWTFAVIPQPTGGENTNGGGNKANYANANLHDQI